MGTPADKPVYGYNCSSGVPDLWLDGETPRFVTVTFSGIVNCWGTPPDLPPRNSWVLQNSESFPCNWTYSDADGWYVEWGIGLAGSILSLQNTTTGQVYFSCTDPSVCQTHFVNSLVCPANHYGEGIGDISWGPDTTVMTVADDYGFCPLTGTLYDKISVGIDHSIIKLANRKDKTNCLFYVDEEEFPPESS